MNTKKINRFEIIDHTVCQTCSGQGSGDDILCPECIGMGAPGRRVIFWDDSKQIDIEIQDDDRTLKVFIHERYEEEA